MAAYICYDKGLILKKQGSNESEPKEEDTTTKAAEVYKANNRPFIAEDFEKMSNDIYAALKAAGAYKDI